MIEIHSLKNIASEQLYGAFKEAFIDYLMQLTQKRLEKMLRRRGYVPELSFGAFEKKQLLAFTFTGIGNFNHISTAYDTGTGTIKQYRGQGLAKRIFEHSIPNLKKAGIQIYLLEVLQHNKNAVSLYQNLGFEVIREFYYFTHHKGIYNLNPKPLEPDYAIRVVDILTLTEQRISEPSENIDFDDFLPSWQNSYESIIRGISEFTAQAVYYQKKLVAYCIYEPGSGDITKLSVSKTHRRKGLGTNLLAYALQDILSEEMQVINIPTDADGILAFLSSINLKPSGKQYEMKRKL